VKDDDLKTQDAVLRKLQVIGEAAKRVSDGTRASHPEVAPPAGAE
jgi:uncharacterized protein with HEPN domain